MLMRKKRLLSVKYMSVIPLDDIEEAFEGENTETEGCSSLMTPAPPKMKAAQAAFILFIYLFLSSIFA